MSKRPIMVAAGGTGGHLFPAQALAEVLIARGHDVELITDERAVSYGKAFPAKVIHHIAAATPSGGSLFARARAILTLIRGTQAARKIIRAANPRALVGFGGYPTVPPVLAATQLKVPAILHEQNAVMGRANKFLAGRVKAVAKGFDHLAAGSARIAAKTTLTGNPVRPNVIAAARRPYPAFDFSVVRLLVTGGSQGARVMSDVVPAAVALLTPAEREKIDIVQQARPEDEPRVKAAYAKLGVNAEVASFFNDLPDRIADAHLVIGRAGASTVSELAVIGRPSILVPLPHALDQDQAANAAILERAGAALVIKQVLFTPEWLADTIRQAMLDKEGLTAQAFAAKRTGIADAAGRLADLVESVMSQETPA